MFFQKYHIFEDFLRKNETFPGSRESGILKKNLATPDSRLPSPKNGLTRDSASLPRAEAKN